MMATAQGAFASMPTHGASLSAEQLHEVAEYEKIVRFRDAVVAGTHPRIKIPSHLAGKQVNSSTRNIASPNPPTTNWRAPPPKPHSRSTSGTYHEPSSPYYNNNNSSPSNQRISTNGYAAMSSKSEINPILLEKSDDLIKAEIQLQRQRLERGLREQVEQQRLAAKLQTSEAVANFDVAEVLSKALAIVHPSSAAEAAPSVGARSSASDSFDENTFYSSQHDTPGLSSPSQGHHDPLEVQADGVVSAYQRPAQNDSATDRIGDDDVAMTGASLSTNNHLPGQTLSQIQSSSLQKGLQNASYHFEQTRHAEHLDSGNSLRQTGKASNFGGENRMNTVSTYHKSNPSADMGSWLDFLEYDVDEHSQNSSDELVRQAFEDDSESTVVRAHNLSPYAPQPARVSPLATARNPPVLRDALPADEAPPAAQVAALRKPGLSSADSSPKGSKPSKKKDKKKKRKASCKDDIPTPDSPYIKPEPRSPSPFAVVPLPRPQKRQRQLGQYASELNYDEPRYDEEVQERVVGRLPERYKEIPAYDRYEERYEARRPEATYQREERDEVEYRRVSDGNYARRPQSPVYALPYPPGEVRSVRAASHAIVERRPREEHVYYREPIPRASVHPDADRERSRSPIMRERRSPIPMGPPPGARRPIRIVVDAYGREYIDPTPASSMRQSVIPTARYQDAELVYEQAPVRTVSSHAPIEYDEDGRIYRRPSPTEMVPRRVVTQPEYVVPEHRAYRQREYSVRPMAPPGNDYIQLRGAADRRQMSHFEEAPREYIPRAASVRPAAAAEPIRYELPREYVGRQSVRSEGAPRDITAPPQREYSVRPVESALRREQIDGRQGERYYEEVPSRRAAADVTFERPRAREQSVLVYADDVRREVRDVYR